MNSSGEVQAGDGENGAVPVANPDNPDTNVVALRYRHGGGKRGNVAPKAISQLVTPVDDIDRVHRSGWSVVVTGTARQLTGLEAAEAAELPLEPWSSLTGDHLIAITIDLVSGRRIGALVTAGR